MDGYQIVKTLVFLMSLTDVRIKIQLGQPHPLKKKKKVSVYKTSQTIHISEYACIGTKQYGEVSKAHT